MTALPKTDLTGAACWSRKSDMLFQDSLGNLHRQTDRLFASLMVLQWLAGIAAACWISPRTWIGATSHIHFHVWAAVLFGALIASLPIFLAWKQPGHAITRHCIAIAQMVFSGLLVHLTGGRIETHFHIFGSLAFLAFYRDWRVLLTATLVTGVDHFARGLFWPQSIFGILSPTSWRWLEHAGWVLFEDAFLVFSIRQSLREMRDVADRRARLETVNEEIENQVAERTVQLLEATRRVGMAQAATGILHNVGNVLNSVNVASTMVTESLRKSKASNLSKVVALLREHESDLGHFLTTDAKGKQVPGYLAQLADHLVNEQTEALKELSQLQKNIQHIKEIVTMQQGMAKTGGRIEKVEVGELVESALQINEGTLTRHNIVVLKELGALPPVMLHKHKVLQILVNLVNNAKQACEASAQPEKRICIHTALRDEQVRIVVTDNGVGITPEAISQIFTHGFTTKSDGHGFGLHSGGLAAQEMGGTLTATSEGSGMGASFILQLPYVPTEPHE